MTLSDISDATFAQRYLAFLRAHPEAGAEFTQDRVTERMLDELHFMLRTLTILLTQPMTTSDFKIKG